MIVETNVSGWIKQKCFQVIVNIHSLGVSDVNNMTAIEKYKLQVPNVFK